MKILLVDDDFFFQKAMSFYLIAEGHEVIFATDGQKASNIATLNPDIDLVICDIDMPVLMGHEFLASLPYLHLDKLPKVIIATGMPENSAFFQNRSLSYDYYFEKPVDVNRLDEILRSIVAKQ